MQAFDKSPEKTNMFATNNLLMTNTAGQTAAKSSTTSLMRKDSSERIISSKNFQNNKVDENISIALSVLKQPQTTTSQTNIANLMKAATNITTPRTAKGETLPGRYQP